MYIQYAFVIVLGLYNIFIFLLTIACFYIIFFCDSQSWKNMLDDDRVFNISQNNDVESNDSQANLKDDDGNDDG